MDVPGNLDTTIVYIAADSRTGSTLLDMLIGAHNDVVSVGELRRLHEHYNGNFACTCEALFCDCPFWGKLNNEFQQDGRSLTYLGI